MIPMHKCRPDSGHDTVHLALSVFAAFLARIGGFDRFDIGYTSSELRCRLSGFGDLFADVVPLRLEVDCSSTFEHLVEQVHATKAACDDCVTYVRDVSARYPELRNRQRQVSALTVTIEIGCFIVDLRTIIKHKVNENN